MYVHPSPPRSPHSGIPEGPALGNHHCGDLRSSNVDQEWSTPCSMLLTPHTAHPPARGTAPATPRCPATPPRAPSARGCIGTDAPNTPLLNRPALRPKAHFNKAACLLSVWLSRRAGSRLNLTIATTTGNMSFGRCGAVDRGNLRERRDSHTLKHHERATGAIDTL